MKKEDIRQVAILRIIRAGHGLAKCMNTLEEVFIPKVMIDQYKLQMNSVCFVEVMPTPKEELKRLEGEGKLFSQYKAKVIYDKSSPFYPLLEKFSVTDVSRASVIEPQERLINWDEAILNVLRQKQEFYSSSEVMEMVEDQYGVMGSNKDISSKLQGLHTRGKISKVTLSNDGKQDKVSKVAWCYSQYGVPLFKKHVLGYGEADEDEQDLHPV